MDPQKVIDLYMLKITVRGPDNTIQIETFFFLYFD